jgi:hypothetical protein
MIAQQRQPKQLFNYYTYKYVLHRFTYFQKITIILDIHKILPNFNNMHT